MHIQNHYYGWDDEVLAVELHEPGLQGPVPEMLVQDLWQTRRFRQTGLETTSGEPIDLLDPGRPNPDGGPDFRDAHLRIGGIEWYGDVEVHLRSGEWNVHRHTHDPRYNRVVLHVALDPDLWTGTLRREDGTLIPELVLAPLLDTPLRQLLHQFYTQSEQAIPCGACWSRVPVSVKQPWIAHLAQERFHARQQCLLGRFRTAGSLETLLHEGLFAGLGYAKNTEALASLARRIPLGLLRRIDDPFDREALHLGVAGLLPEPGDLLEADRATADYGMYLRDSFVRLQHWLDLPVMPRTAWQFFRLRPANFPPLRIAQGVALAEALLQNDPVGTLLTALASSAPVEVLRQTLRARPGPFWDTHVRLEKATTRPRDPAIGQERVDALLVNAVLPVLLLHARQQHDPVLEARIYDLLHQLPAEDDEVTRCFAALGTQAHDAFTAQGLHQLYRTRCTQGHCLTCPVGQHLLETAWLSPARTPG
jgi:hypothetical protein